MVPSPAAQRVRPTRHGKGVAAVLGYAAAARLIFIANRARAFTLASWGLQHLRLACGPAGAWGLRSALVSWLCAGALGGLSACIIPLAPEFEPPERNMSPYIVNTSPAQGSFVSENEEIAVTLADPNLGDTLYFRWVFNYPPYVELITRAAVEDSIVAPLTGSPIRARVVTIKPSCVRDLVAGISPHRAMLLVSDRPFLERDNSPYGVERVPQDAFVVKASWWVQKVCQ